MFQVFKKKGTTTVLHKAMEGPVKDEELNQTLVDELNLPNFPLNFPSILAS